MPSWYVWVGAMFLGFASCRDVCNLNNLEAFCLLVIYERACGLI
jgi:hypothetical protein